MTAKAKAAPVFKVIRQKKIVAAIIKTEHYRVFSESRKSKHRMDSPTENQIRIKERNEAIVKEAETGRPLKTIANLFQVTPECVRLIIKKAGVNYKSKKKELRLKERYGLFLQKARELNCIPPVAVSQALKIQHADRLLFSERLKKMGFKIPKAAGYRRFTKEELLNDLKRVADKLGKTPTNLELYAHGNYAHVTYYHYFGSMRKAQKEAGLLPNKRGGDRRPSKRPV